MSDTTTTVDYVKLAAALVGLAQHDLGALDAREDFASVLASSTTPPRWAATTTPCWRWVAPD
jgi:hypothetical protein